MNIQRIALSFSFARKITLSVQFGANKVNSEKLGTKAQAPCSAPTSAGGPDDEVCSSTSTSGLKRPMKN
ncbi:hypothetical protein [Robertmurraya kyonggiensis]|uniref:Uncharacterized protein n=1 Tax=Robertmurraya kyonggiensis TaxID=1037680 RepID=A0A4U1D6Q1_9BACI|nr:hypothetical protein [Robertmurraya kyonggiensis]TKC18134.1 hypothetical protein FA727_00830 [Robertmurraya kyonggiensis]